jgi:hypothetical protein
MDEEEASAVTPGEPAGSDADKAAEGQKVSGAGAGPERKDPWNTFGYKHGRGLERMRVSFDADDLKQITEELDDPDAG